MVLASFFDFFSGESHTPTIRDRIICMARVSPGGGEHEGGSMNEGGGNFGPVVEWSLGARMKSRV